MTNSKEVKAFVIVAAIVLLLFKGFKLLDTVLEALGVKQSKDSKNFDEQISNPYSFWNGLFWKQGGAGTKIITEAKCNWLYNEIWNSFGVFNDDEGRIYSAFKTLTTQSQLSYFSYWLKLNKQKDLLDWLKGSNTGPVGDHLSTSEIAVITKYFNTLPKYR